MNRTLKTTGDDSPSPTLTPHQQAAEEALLEFIAGPPGAFVLTGSAGTGKTTLLRSLYQSLEAEGLDARLVAPTGRAARVLKRRTGFDARTAHSHLYTPEPFEDRPGIRLVRKDALDDALDVLIVDEASMVPSRLSSDGLFVARAALLDDLVDEAFRHHSHLVFVGDPCQLPPVGEGESVALRPDLLQARYGLRTESVHLHEVLRQSDGSVVLEAAIALRDALENVPARAVALPFFEYEGDAVEDYLATVSHGRYERAVMLAYLNRSVLKLNRIARAALGLTGVLVPRDLVVTDRDAWIDGRLVPRAESFVVDSVEPAADFAGLRFARVRLEPVADGVDPVEGAALLDTLIDPYAKISHEREMHLFSEAMKQNSAFRKSRNAADDPHVSALRLRYGHALTVHKAQGGEWECVYLNPFVPPMVQPVEAIRWRYTALTRAAEYCYLVGASGL